MGKQLLLPLCLFAGLLLMPAEAAARRKKKPAPLPPEAALSETLNTKRDEIQNCAVDFALKKGAQKAEITTSVTINSAGQVIDNRIKVVVEGGDGEQVKSCVEKVVHGIKFPKSDAPIINIERTWTVSAS
jgi:hypothetical protein